MDRELTHKPPTIERKMNKQDKVLNATKISTEPMDNDYKSIQDAIKIAKGCLDYGGGYRGTPEFEVYHHGIQTVINALKAAERNGTSDTQVNALVKMGETVHKNA